MILNKAQIQEHQKTSTCQIENKSYVHFNHDCSKCKQFNQLAKEKTSQKTNNEIETNIDSEDEEKHCFGSVKN